MYNEWRLVQSTALARNLLPWRRLEVTPYVSTLAIDLLQFAFSAKPHYWEWDANVGETLYPAFSMSHSRVRVKALLAPVGARSRYAMWIRDAHVGRLIGAYAVLYSVDVALDVAVVNDLELATSAN
jgi:hypothetical protein